MRSLVGIGSFVASLLAVDLAAAQAVVWREDWPRFRLLEGAATAGLTLGSYAAERKLDAQASPAWTGGILFDVPVRDLLRASSPRTQEVFAHYSDIGGRFLAFYPYIVDAGILALGVHRAPDVALQLFLIDLQALSLTGAVTIFTEKVVGRQRPFARDCGPDGKSGSHECGGSGDNMSFFSGHTSTVFTSAGLTCVHHEHLALWGGGAADRWACYWALTLATFTGVSRIVSDNHYASDVLVGAGVGAVSGYFIPKWLHYTSQAHRGPELRVGMKIVPTFAPAPNTLGFGIAGTL